MALSLRTRIGTQTLLSQKVCPSCGDVLDRHFQSTCSKADSGVPVLALLDGSEKETATAIPELEAHHVKVRIAVSPLIQKGGIQHAKMLVVDDSQVLIGGVLHHFLKRVGKVNAMKRCLKCLNELPLFQGLDKPQFVNVCLNATKKTIAKGDYLFRQAEHADSICLIKAGKLKLVYYTEEGRENILDIVGIGEVLGETALFQEQEQPFSAIALEETRLCCFNREQFEILIRQNPAFAIKIIGHLGKKLYQSLRQAGEDAGIPVKEKLLRVFIRLAEDYGRKVSDGTLIELEITQQELANMVGASRVMVAQILKELKKAGIVLRNTKHYVLRTDPCLEKHFR